jgi:hypothetical protein
MKYLLIIMIALTGLVVPQQKVLKGKYRMVFEKEFSSQNGLITFEKNTYNRRIANGKLIKGTVEYGKNSVVLKDENNVYQIEVSEKTIGNNEVQFRTIEVGKVTDAKTRGNMVFYPGKMIKLKSK